MTSVKLINHSSSTADWNYSYSAIFRAGTPSQTAWEGGGTAKTNSISPYYTVITYGYLPQHIL